MNAQELLFRFIIGGLAIVLISLLSESKYKTLSGLVVLFPTVTGLGYYYASKTMTNAEMQDMAIFSLLLLPTLGLFL